MTYLWLKWVHILSATVLFGTGLGIAWFKYRADRSGDPGLIVGVSRLTVTADYFDIGIDETIDNLFADDTIKACAETGNPDVCRLIHRDARYTLWLTNDGYTISTNQNIGKVKMRGIDARG